MSNQVYSDLQNATPYNGQKFETQYTLVSNAGAPPPTTFIGVVLQRVNPKQVMFTINGSQSGVAWGVGTNNVSAPAGTLPAEFRPIVTQYFPFWVVRIGAETQGRLRLNQDGAISLALFDAAGAPQVFVAGDQIVPMSCVYSVA